MVSYLTSKRLPKLLPVVGMSAGKIASRRLLSQLMCRLPLLTVWTLVVIFLLYKSLSNSSSSNESENDERQLQATLKALNQEQTVSSNSREKYQLLNDQPPILEEAELKIVDEMKSNVINERFPSVKERIPVPNSSQRSIKNEYIRQSKVFILIIQNENLRLSNFIHPSRQSSQHTSSSIPDHFTSSRKSRHNIIPQHIKILIEILEAHRIGYTIDTTRTGLPTTLLTDQDNPSETKQYSVIIVDDFVKYTKLSRWVRDQLDRHCRTNQIGVVTYLTSNGLGSQTFDERKSHVRHEFDNHFVSRRHGISTTEESLADQFPFIFKSIDGKVCRNLSSPCLIDQQLNEKSTILRILKRRPNFILPGPLIPNVNQLPWVSMSSDHVTYEPLTWAKFNRPAHQTNRNQRNISLSPIRTQQKNQANSDSRLGDGLQVEDVSSRVDYSYESNQASSSEYNRAMPDNEKRFPSSYRDYNNSSITSHETSSLSDDGNSTSNRGDTDNLLVLSMFDRGLYDGIKRVIFGGANHHWLNRILLLDAIEHLSSGRILSPLDRYIQIDIDDVFVGEKGKRMIAEDVEALVGTQHRFAQSVDGGFKFNLGYSGKYYKHGHEDENIGDEKLVANAKEFTWFCHTWSHSKAHLFNETQSIATELKRNLRFAQEHGLPIVGHAGLVTDSTGTLPPTYAVAPHHSGVYPVHEQLYEAWKSVLNVQVTSTEEYPHLRPASARRAFVHNAIKVLQRQTCGLYSHTIYKQKYPGGMERLNSLIRGGELFETILHNPVNIYMTHMSNYANDRLALYTFSSLLDFVQRNTNLQLKYASENGENEHLAPLKLADYYFDLYPIEKQPLWTNPCSDKRHLAIWAAHKRVRYCPNIPQLLIVGPQKTGTTALYSFLKINPLFRSSLMSATDYEEVQFFNDKHYFKGVDWYFERFQQPISGNFNYNSSMETYYFDKSATYFDDPKVAQRAANLLPGARIVILLVNPADRAYSWYQHIKAHGDQAANSMTFEQVIMSNGLDDDKVDQKNRSWAIKALRSRCLHPGYYSQHLSRWLEYYPSKQIIIIDGQWFKNNPASVMNRLQLLLRVAQPLEYNDLLVYNEEKGFYCQLSRANVQQSGQHDKQVVECLGRSKGRNYPPMSEEARNYLNKHYWPHNRQLAQILSDIGQPLPTWLDETMTLASVRSVI